MVVPVRPAVTKPGNGGGGTPPGDTPVLDNDYVADPPYDPGESVDRTKPSAGIIDVLDLTKDANKTKTSPKKTE